MKRFTSIISYSVIILSCFYLQNTLCIGPVPYVVNLKLPRAGVTIPGYYQGFRLLLDEGRALIPCNAPLVFSLVIAESFSFKMQDKTVSSLTRRADAPCVWYDLTLTFNNKNEDDTKEESQRDYTWRIEKKSLNDVPKRLPVHALVLLFDPQFIETVVDSEDNHTPDIINLPTIVFKELSTKKLTEDFNAALVIAAMNALDLDAIHCKERPSCFANHSTIPETL